MLPNSWMAREAMADFAEHERWEVEMQALGVSAADLREFEAIIEGAATRSTFPNHVIIHEGRVLARRLASRGDALLPTAETRDSWVAQFVQSAVLGGVLDLCDPFPVRIFMETAKAAVDESLESR